MPVPIETVRQAITEHEASLEPADMRVVIVELDKVCAVHGTPAGWDGMVDDYLEAFDGVPFDLVKVACKHARLDLKFFPKPAELRAPIRDELNARRDTLRRLRTAEMKAKPAKHQPEPPRERTPEELAAVAAAKEAALQALSAGPVKAMPAERDDLKPQRDDSTAAARRRVAEGLAGFRKVERTAQPWGDSQ
ncbi:hypothetical protein D9623_33750 (plasmid) [Azospirillum brasilense]|uniref:Uncharacterized protein n=1 Tax=Azospirillum brasilense TaxID=192 RepID=A0A4D8R0Y6_AZOBR|nr:hypothetical protein D3868_28075 [Azospirillum brasilense]QEL94834.1 hypothetical protein D9621_32400 [Azospirillum brasilense]QEM00016.1 hypothetical protein D9623_26680 [Azospirillum brasilense]QEM01382.1 hypothetical protein D9623_33750 [Azospirillum brasilense]